ncbi:MAG: glycoside hydrolase family 52 protein [Armatimonadota bacterium]|nr:glycoside hydrolase family 52 protein [Armatimonadota bacterium]
MNKKTHNYNAHHAPIGAFASFTLGFRGDKGGLGLELDRPANQNIYIGAESEPHTFDFLPFFDQAAGEGEARRYDVEGNNAGNVAPAPRHVGQPEDGTGMIPARIRALAPDTIEREFRLAMDAWSAPAFSFAIYSPVRGVPDPMTAAEDALKAVLVPAVLCELMVDNAHGQTARRAVFGFAGDDPYSAMRLGPHLEL